MYDTEEHSVDSHTEELKKLVKDTEDLVSALNESNKLQVTLKVETKCNQRGYCKILVVNNNDNTTIPYLVFATKLNNTTNRFIVPLEFVLDKVEVTDNLIVKFSY